VKAAGFFVGGFGQLPQLLKRQQAVSRRSPPKSPKSQFDFFARPHIQTNFQLSPQDVASFSPGFSIFPEKPIAEPFVHTFS